MSIDKQASKVADNGLEMIVIVVSYNSATVIIDCLDSLFSSDAHERISVIVIDNASTDGTLEAVDSWATKKGDFRAQTGPVRRPSVQKPIPIYDGEADTVPWVGGAIIVLRSTFNGGYAYGVNRGIELASKFGEVDAFWILNPDCVVPPHTPGKYLDAVKSGPFGLLSGRCLLYDEPTVVQTDGGRVNRHTGKCSSLNAGKDAAETELPNAQNLDFVSGANFVVSRAFIVQVGLMSEDYFLYYEEVDWAMRRGNFTFGLVPGAEVYHRGGTAIGSATLRKAPSPLANYFSHRNRVLFIKKYYPAHYLFAQIWTLLKFVQALVQGGITPAWALLAGGLNLRPPKSVSCHVNGVHAKSLAFNTRDAGSTTAHAQRWRFRR